MGKGIFFTSASMLLAVILTTTLRHHHHPHNRPNNLSLPNYTSNASKLLRSNGFNFISNFLHISPELFVSNTDSSLTIFAVPDAAISNLSIPPYMIKHLLAYHTSPTKLTLQDLFKKPLKTCLPTLIPHHTVSITKIDYKRRVLEINNVLITHPDLFLQGHVTIHGVAGSFATFDHHQESIVLPFCEADDIGGFVKNKDEWGRMIKFLGSSGFMAFAIGLKSVTDGIFKDFPDLKSVTVFVTRNVALRVMSSPLLDKFMRFHIVTQRYGFKELEGLPPGAKLSTLVTGKHVGVGENSKVVMIDEVSITAPDLFVSKNLVVHGIARALSMDELSSMSR
ncbi:putative FAS1 domain-containing protein [Helianthus debilis subsp. tardiflorus]